jgi:hypothetical protein
VSCGRAGVRSDARPRPGRSPFAPARCVVAGPPARSRCQKERLASIRPGADLGRRSDLPSVCNLSSSSLVPRSIPVVRTHVETLRT